MIVLLISILFLLFSQRIILVNEETLVLICFFIVIYNGFKHFNFLTNSFFIRRSIDIKKRILSSFLQLEKALNKIISSMNLRLLIRNIKRIKRHCLKLSQNFIKWFLADILNKIKVFYPKYLQFIKVIELKVVRLIMFFLFDKLSYVLVMVNFFRSNFIIQKILGYNLLNLRESIFQFKKFYR